jgi:hypothetical protein
MAKDEKKQDRSHRGWTIVRETLLQQWDPIGIRDVPGGESQYDRYVSTVCEMLLDHRASEQVIREYLLTTATGYMGLLPTPDIIEGASKTAEILISLRPQLEAH